MCVGSWGEACTRPGTRCRSWRRRAARLVRYLGSLSVSLGCLCHGMSLWAWVLGGLASPAIRSPSMLGGSVQGCHYLCFEVHYQG
jgi:hypothetical protein